MAMYHKYENERVEEHSDRWDSDAANDDATDDHSFDTQTVEVDNDDKDTVTKSTSTQTALDALPRGMSDLCLSSVRASNGIQPWDRGPAVRRRDGGFFPPLGCVSVDLVRLDEPSLRCFDNTDMVPTTLGPLVPYHPLKNGTTIFEYGKGAGKTWRTIEFITALRRDKQRVLFVTARRNLARKLAADLAKQGIAYRNYLDAAEEQVSVGRHCDARVVVISGEQVHRVALPGTQEFAGGVLVIDEYHTLADSFGGPTIDQPIETLTALSLIAARVDYILLLDADASACGKGAALLRAIAPMKNVRHFQSTRPATLRTIFVGWSRERRDKKAFDDRFDLSLYRARQARAAGKPSRVFYGAQIPGDVIKAGQHALTLGIPNKPLHGRMCEDDRRNAFNDPDGFFADDDLIAISTVGAVGMDLSLKCGSAFFTTFKDNPANPVASLRLLTQLACRPGRSADGRLDPLVVDGVLYEGATFVRISGAPPSDEDDRTTTANALLTFANAPDRNTRKYLASQCETHRRIAAAREADAANRVAYLQSSTGIDAVLACPPQPVADEVDQSIESNLAEILAWNETERRDNHEAHSLRLFELLSLPTSGCAIKRIPSLSAEERAELDDFRHAPAIAPIVIDPDGDRAISELSAGGRYELVRSVVAERGEVDFWGDCYSRCCQTHTSRTPATAMDLALEEVWSTLVDIKHFVAPIDYAFLHGDRSRRTMRVRALLRFVPEAHFKNADVRAQNTGHASDVMVHGEVRAAVVVDRLACFAAALGLSSKELLVPVRWTAGDGSWIDAHNRIQQEQATPADEAVRAAAVAAAKKLCAGVRANATIRGCVCTVLAQCCGMVPGTTKNNGLRVTKWGPRGARSCEVVVVLAVTEGAPGCAERVLVWSDKLRRKVMAIDFQSEEAAYDAQCIEQERQRKLNAIDAEYADYGDTQSTVEFTNAANFTVANAPYSPLITYEPYDAEALCALLVDLATDSTARAHAVRRLGALCAEQPSHPSTPRARVTLAALQRLRDHEEFVATLDRILPPAREGVRTLKVVHERAVGTSIGRRRPKGVVMHSNDGQYPRTVSLAGMPRELRPLLTGRLLVDLDGVASVVHVLLTLAARAGLAATETEALRDYLDDRVGWHGAVARELLLNAHGAIDEATVAPLIAHVKRWPPAFAHGSGLTQRLADAGLDTDTKPPPRVVRLLRSFRRLRVLLEVANETFLRRHEVRRRAEGVADDAARTSAWSLLLESVEDEALSISVTATRRLNREAVGGAAFDALPVAERDVGALIFDGHMAALREGVEVADVVAAINSDLSTQGFRYVVAKKDNAWRGIEGVSAVAEGRAALVEAAEIRRE